VARCFCHALRDTLRLWRVVYFHIIVHSGTRCHCGALFIFILRDTCGLWRVIFIYMYSKVQNCRIKRRELLLLAPPYYRELANVLFGILSSELIVFWRVNVWAMLAKLVGNVGEIGWSMLAKLVGQCWRNWLGNVGDWSMCWRNWLEEAFAVIERERLWHEGAFASRGWST
jgi:hypothetical protein